MVALLKFLTGLSAVILLGVIVITLDVAPGSAASAERRLHDSASRRLTTGDFPWALVTMDGNVAHLAGAAPSQEAIAQASQDIRNSIWGGGIAAVDDSAVTMMARLPIADPFLWIAERQGNAVIISGNAPSEAARDDIFLHIEQRFPGAEISGEVEIANGAPGEDRWVSAVFLSLDALSRLQNGAIEANDARFILSGEAANEQNANTARLIMSAFPQGMSGDSNVSLAEPREGSGSVAAQAQRAEDCRARLNLLIAGVEISFQTDSSALDGPSLAQLGVIAEELAACPQFGLQIDGHTDASGRASGNLSLSISRADAVAAFFGSSGIDANRLDAEGYGETRPLASNASAEGRSRNRRIDLTIIEPATP